MASFKYKNMQQFVKQTIHPYIVNVVLLIKDVFRHITRLDKRIDSTNTYIETKVEPRIDVHDRIVGLDKLAKKDNKGNLILDENGNVQLVDNFKDSTSNHETRIQDLEELIGIDYIDPLNFTAATDNHEKRLDGHDKDIANLQTRATAAETKLDEHGVDIASNETRIIALEKSSDTHIANTKNPHSTRYMNLVDVYVSTLPPGNNTTYDVWDQVLPN